MYSFLDYEIMRNYYTTLKGLENIPNIKILRIKKTKKNRVSVSCKSESVFYTPRVLEFWIWILIFFLPSLFSNLYQIKQPLKGSQKNKVGVNLKESFSYFLFFMILFDPTCFIEENNYSSIEKFDCRINRSRSKWSVESIEVDMFINGE